MVIMFWFYAVMENKTVYNQWFSTWVATPEGSWNFLGGVASTIDILCSLHSCITFDLFEF